MATLLRRRPYRTSTAILTNQVRFYPLAADEKRLVRIKLPEVRLVLLGQTGSGKSTAGNCILGCDAFESHASDGVAVTHKCEKKTSTVAGNQVTVVDTPDWFRSDDSPEMVQHQISTCKALLTPGPHAFLLCVPVNKPAIVELQALEALKVVFGAKAVSHHTLVLFTHVDQLPEGQTLENYIASKRQDLLEVTTRCDDRYHFLERGKEDKDRRKSVEELLEKVESMVRESGVEFYNCPPCQQVETPTRLRQKERTKEEQTEKRASLSSSSSSPMPDHPEDTVNITEESPLSEETELTEEDLREEDLAPASSSFFGGLWNSTVGWIRYLISLVRGTTLLGSIVGLGMLVWNRTSIAMDYSPQWCVRG
uniref:AIG1-type G domain-containing protein n=1 Tax=Denticeps clupeoides TaxID=299321 RepID=A0AAY4CSQ6_9TELE